MFLRAFQHVAPRISARTFTTTRVSANVIQDLYLRELKSAKLQPITAKDAEGSVKPWAAPKAPSAPAVEAQGADALQAYAQEDVEVAQPKQESSTDAAEQDWLVLEEAEDDHQGHH
ncbi:LAMI_0G06436g1_1 [Lachancea mirantina]|uniref:LAMI_0G06436g1_1 n=1 Tax=Lachancea mirantina TaxID=1230905 RepID=A0A1G4K955_9SACH|nr:LAMI_0G06436g1_1 [Lachancea mirantina]